MPGFAGVAVLIGPAAVATGGIANEAAGRLACRAAAGCQAVPARFVLALALVLAGMGLSQWAALRRLLRGRGGASAGGPRGIGHGIDDLVDHGIH